MKINNFNLENHFDCKVCEFAYQASNYVSEFIFPKNLMIYKSSSMIQPQERVLVVEFWNEADISKFTSELLKDSVILDLDDGYKYEVYYKGGNNIVTQISDNYYEASFPMYVIQRKSLVKVRITHNKQSCMIFGTTRTPCRYTMVPQHDISQFTINEYCMKNLKAGHKIIFDGIEKVITDNGKNFFGNVENLYTFPSLDIGKQVVEVNNLNIDILLEYYPLFL